MKESNKWTRWFEDLTSEDVARVGGKNASLGEMIRTLKEKGVRVPGGFATTAEAYRRFLEANQLEEKIRRELDAYHQEEQSLAKAGEKIRGLFNNAEFPEEITEAIRSAYRELSERNGIEKLDVAVRSSATAEDLPEASFAGQQESFLNITGDDDLLDACRRCYASLFTDRAIVYRENNGFEHMKVALSVGIQKMVRADRAGAGVMFSIDTETGFPDLVIINAAWGIGENVVQGKINPDEYQVYKPFLEKSELNPIVEKKLGSKEQKMIYAQGGSEPTRNVDTSSEERNAFVLSDGEILHLARWAVVIEDHYGKPMDMEWAKDGEDGELFIVQARPETVQSQKEASLLKAFTLKETGKLLVSGLAIGDEIAAGTTQVIQSADDIDNFEDGNILVTGMTDPDWVPAMKKAAGIITDQGGRTSHAAIVSRELGIPAVVGCGDATEVLEDGIEITLSCAEGERGNIYQGKLDFEAREIKLEEIPETKTQIMMNIANPAAAFRWWRLPVNGVGLARIEFIINNAIKIHPMALVHFDELQDEKARKQIAELTRGYGKTDYFVEHLARGIARIAAAQYPDPVIVRMSDFKTNEYAGLIGGAPFEPQEENPMLGFRGASRYYSDRYREGFALECQALKKVREEIGFKNVVVMIPFCRTLREADRVLEVLAENGLRRGENDLQVYVMAEIPSNVILAEQFAERFDGFSIGSNDLTQLILGVDRDEEELSELFDERDEAVRKMVKMLIEKAHQAGSKVGICGQAPSDYPEFAAFLVREGIDSISLNPDSILQIKQRVSEVERGED
jgi:pyruvate, water dikinase